MNLLTQDYMLKRVNYLACEATRELQFLTIFSKAVKAKLKVIDRLSSSSSLRMSTDTAAESEIE